MRALAVALLCAAALAAPSRPSRPMRRNIGDYGNTPIWPLPASAVPSGTNTHLDSTFQIVVSPAIDPFLQTIATRYMPIIVYQNMSTPPGPVLHTLYVNVNDTSLRFPVQGMDESYTLTFAADGSSATVQATTLFGARHGLESFSQLVQADRLSGVFSVSGLNVVDAPRFTYRGLLIDSARHWLPPNLLLSIMDAMSFNKMNTLQLGAAIDWSWTVQSLVYPNLTAVSYGPANTHIYSRDTVQWLVQEAAYRGIRLIPYMEVFGHDALGYALPELMWCNGVQGKGGLPHPLHNWTWQVFQNIFSDYRAIFQEEYMNVGGDEVDISCWQQDPEILAWLTSIGHPGDFDYITALYFQQMTAVLKASGWKPIFFAEAFGSLNATGVDLTGTDVVFDAWDPDTPGSTAPIIQAPGTSVIISSYCFLAPTNSCPDNLPGGLTPNWDSNLRCEPQNTSLFPSSAWPYLDKIIGGHPSRWGEQTDGTNIFTVTWPAVMGAAEKLWSPAALTNGSYYPSRQEVFADHRCVLIRRGIPVQPTSAYSWSCDYEWEPVYPPLTPLSPNKNNSSWVNPTSSAASNVQPATAAGSDARVRELEAALSAAHARIQDLEAQLKQQQRT